MDELDFSYECPEPGRITVRVDPNHWSREVKVVNELEKALKERIPFEYSIADEPEVQTLGGHARGIMCVQMTISPKIDVDEAVHQLQANGFTDEFRPLID